MEFNAGSETHPCISASSYRSERTMYEFSVTKGLLRDEYYYFHRHSFDNFPVLLSCYPCQEWRPQIQAEYFLKQVSPLTELDMIILAPDITSELQDPYSFVCEWMEYVLARTGKKPFLQVTESLHKYFLPMLDDFIIKAPRLSSNDKRTVRPYWKHDIHYYSNHNKYGPISYTNLTVDELLRSSNGV